MIKIKWLEQETFHDFKSTTDRFKYAATSLSQISAYELCANEVNKARKVSENVWFESKRGYFI